MTLTRILGLSGSLRHESLNRKLLEESSRRLAPAAQLEIYSIGELPLYNEDLDRDSRPPAVEALAEALNAADALMIATPEYNYGVPGVLKNALDWASRPAYRSPLAGLPVGIMSASPSPVGGSRAQAQLKQVLSGTLSPIYPAPELCLPFAPKAFSDSGRLVDDAFAARLARYLDEFVAWVSSRSKTT